MSKTRSIVIEVGDGVVKITGDTYGIRDTIKDVARDYGLDWKFNRRDKNAWWEVSFKDPGVARGFIEDLKAVVEANGYTVNIKDIEKLGDAKPTKPEKTEKKATEKGAPSRRKTTAVEEWELPSEEELEEMSRGDETEGTTAVVTEKEEKEPREEPREGEEKEAQAQPSYPFSLVQIINLNNVPKVEPVDVFNHVFEEIKNALGDPVYRGSSSYVWLYGALSVCLCLEGNGEIKVDYRANTSVESLVRSITSNISMRLKSVSPTIVINYAFP